MTALKITLQVIVVLLSFVLTLLILMHKGKGGGLSDMFGGGLTQIGYEPDGTMQMTKFNLG